MILHVPQPDDIAKKKLYSISSADTQTTSFDLLTKLIPNGIGSTYLDGLQLGDEVLFDGPAGVFTLKEEQQHNGRDKVFIATGTGVAPARSIIVSSLSKHPDEKFILLWGLPKEDDVYLLDDWKKLQAEHDNFHFMIFLSRAVEVPQSEHFMLGRVNKGIDELQERFGSSTGGSISNFDVYIAGDRDIVESIKQYMLLKGADKEHLVFEKFV